MNYIHMDTLTRAFAAIGASARGSGAAAELQLPRTRQDVVLKETSVRAQASVSHPRVTNIDSSTRKLRNGLLYGPSLLNTAEDGGNQSRMWYSISIRSSLTECAASTIIKRGTIPAGSLHFANPVPDLPEGWVGHTHLEGKLYYVRDESNPIQGAPRTLTIVTDADPRIPRNLRGLESVHRKVVEVISAQGMSLPNKVQLFIEIYPEQDDYKDVGGYYLADLDNQSILWYGSLLQFSQFHISLFALGFRTPIRRISAWATRLILASSMSSTSVRDFHSSGN